MAPPEQPPSPVALRTHGRTLRCDRYMAPPKGGGRGGRGRGRGRGGKSGGSRTRSTPTPSVALSRAQQDMVSELLAGSGPVVAWSAQEASGGAAAAASAPAAAAKREPAVTAASEARLQQQGDVLRAAFEQQQQSPAWLKMQPGRRKLPALAARDSLMQTIAASDVTVVAGGTGCGKSTQVPQFLLNEMLASGKGGSANIICTQPRRIAAVGVAERVAEERGEPIGHSVGYTIRGESKRSAASRLVFCTTGVLLKMLEEDHDLGLVTHVVIDEVHERSCDSDLLLLMCRKMLASQKTRAAASSSSGPAAPRLKLVLMSATLDSKVFAKYFEQSGLSVGIAEIEGVSPIHASPHTDTSLFSPACCHSSCLVLALGGAYPLVCCAWVQRTFPVERLYLSDAIEHCGYDCRGGYHSRPEVTSAMLSKQNGNGGTEGESDRVDIAGGGAEGEDDAGEMSAGQKIIAANRKARLQKEKNASENSASGSGKLGGLVHAWCDAVGQQGMLRDKSAGLAARSCSGETLDVLRTLDHGQVPNNVDLVVQLVRYIASKPKSADAASGGGAVLVFLPGTGEITTMLRAMQADRELGRSDCYLLLPLHSELSTGEQKQVFRHPPPGVTKVRTSATVWRLSLH